MVLFRMLNCIKREQEIKFNPSPPLIFSLWKNTYVNEAGELSILSKTEKKIQLGDNHRSGNLFLPENFENICCIVLIINSSV